MVYSPSNMSTPNKRIKKRADQARFFISRQHYFFSVALASFVAGGNFVCAITSRNTSGSLPLLRKACLCPGRAIVASPAPTVVSLPLPSVKIPVPAIIDLFESIPKIYNSRMKYENLIQRSDREFKRLTGVAPILFHEMLRITTEAESQKTKPGRPHTLASA